MNNQLLYNFLKLSLRKFSDNFNINHTDTDKLIEKKYNTKLENIIAKVGNEEFINIEKFII